MSSSGRCWQGREDSYLVPALREIAAVVVVVASSGIAKVSIEMRLCKKEIALLAILWYGFHFLQLHVSFSFPPMSTFNYLYLPFAIPFVYFLLIFRLGCADSTPNIYSPQSQTLIAACCQYKRRRIPNSTLSLYQFQHQYLLNTYFQQSFEVCR